jgi:hypothetical protein
MNYNNYPEKGIDKKIKDIQNVLNSKLGFENVDFYGRVQRTIMSQGKLFIPTVQISNTESKTVYYDDKNAPGGSVFFIDEKKHTTKDGIVYNAKVKVVFMLNLNKVITPKDYRADAEIQEEIIKLLRKTKLLEITEIEKGLNEILSEFDVSNIKKNDTQPYHIFSINGNLKYQFNC